MISKHQNLLTFLCLADCQFEKSHLTPSQEALLIDLAKQKENGFAPTIIFVPGDVAQSGQTVQYETAQVFFRKVLEVFDVDRTNLFIIPGNHDIDRTRIPGTESLDAFYNFVEQMTGRPSPFKNEQVVFSENFSINGIPIAIINVNTAYIDASSSTKEKFKDLANATRSALEHSKDAKFRIALSHHRPNELSRFDNSQTDRLLNGNANIIIHAHRHESKLGNSILVQANNQTAVILNTGALFGRDVPHPNVYSYIEYNLDIGQGRLFERYYQKDKRQWIELGSPLEFKGISLPDQKHPTLRVISSAAYINIFEAPQLGAPVVELASGGSLLELVNGDINLPESWLSIKLPNGKQGFIQASQIESLDAPAPNNSPIPRIVRNPNPEPTSSSTLQIKGIVSAGYDNDSALVGEDHLGIADDITAFSTVFAAKEVEPPLCMGLFGDWGSGKSFFMRNLRDSIEDLSRQAREAEANKRPNGFCLNIVQVEFNAWHFMDTNLWASLSSHIFTQLDKYMEEQNKAKHITELFLQLNAAQKIRHEAVLAVNNAKEELGKAEENLASVRKTATSTQNELSQVIKNLSDDKDVKEARDVLKSTVQEMGWGEISDTLDNGREKLKELHSLGGRIYALILWFWSGTLKDRILRIGLSLLILLIVPFLPALLRMALQAFNPSIQLSMFNTSVTQLTTFFTGLIGWLSWVIKKVSDGIGKIEKAQEKVEESYAKVRKESEAKIQETRREVEYLRQAELVAQQALSDAQHIVAVAENKLRQAEQMNSGQSLADFIRDQASNHVLRSQLGLISLIRENLETLASLLSASSNEQGKPHIDRIILYIDDLDRCSEEKVVEVLQAIHMLLAFKLFIVVVGVDSRWLLHSLEKAYPALQISETNKLAWAEDKNLVWESTPQNYLEKIFQIPYHLRPMDKFGFEQLVNSLMPKKGQANLDSKTEEITPDSSVKVQNPAVQGPKTQSEQQSAPSSVRPAQVIRHESASTLNNQRDLTASFLELHNVEKAFLPTLAGLIHTPRSTKRFMNLYRMIRAGIPPDRLDSFLDTDFRAVMILLAILTGYPQQAPHFFRKLLNLENHHPWKDALGLLKPRQVASGKNEFENGLLHRFSSADAVEWKKLYLTISEISAQETRLPETTEPYRTWIPHVSRYSFYVGKIMENVELCAKITIKTVETDETTPAPGEFVEIHNSGDCAQLLTGWTLSDQVHHTYVFPSIELTAGGFLRVWTAPGVDTPTELHWGRNASVWNNTGDVASLRDMAGSLVENYQVQAQRRKID